MLPIGATIRDLRKSRGISQRELAEMFGISEVHLSNIENDKSNPSFSLLDQYGEEFGVDAYVLAWCKQSANLTRSVRFAAKKLLRALDTNLGQRTTLDRDESV